jgi:hypothetical protein
LSVKLLLALFTTGTNDSITWDYDVATMRSSGAIELYRHGVQYMTSAGTLGGRQKFIHPPASLHGLLVLGALQDVTGLPPHVWMRVGCSLADVGTLMLLWLMFPEAVYRPALVLVAVSPLAVMVSGFHGNQDPIMMFFVVLSVWLLKKNRVGWAGVAFGLALGVKLVPVIFAPALLLSIASSRNRVRWTGAVVVTWIAASLPWLIEAPRFILGTISGYSGSTGLWGFYLLAGILRDSGYPVWYQIYAPCAKWIALGAIAAFPLILRYRRLHLNVFAECGLVASLFLFLSPGFGLQYLAWTVPWVVILAPRVIARYFAVACIFMLGVYTEAAWANGGRFYADLLLNTNWHLLIELGIVCWVVMGIMAGSYWRLVVRSTELPAADSRPAQPARLCGNENR